MKVAELKAALKARGLTTTGNKQELIERLQLASMSNEGDANDTDLLEDANELLGGDDDEVPQMAPAVAAPPKAAEVHKKVTIDRTPAVAAL